MLKIALPIAILLVVLYASEGVDGKKRIFAHAVKNQILLHNAKIFSSFWSFFCITMKLIILNFIFTDLSSRWSQSLQAMQRVHVQIAKALARWVCSHRHISINLLHQSIVFPGGFGALTRRGWQQHKRLGRWFRRRYRSLLINGNYTPNLVYIKSTVSVFSLSIKM